MKQNGFVAQRNPRILLFLIRQRGIAGRSRITRHFWRMCFAFFEATSAFFIGKQKVFPMFLHGSPILIVLGVAPLVVMIFYFVRVRSTALVTPSRTL